MNRRRRKRIALKTLARLAVLVAGCVPLAAHAACQQPDAIDVPNGARASLEGMLAAQSELRAYMAEMESYLACLNEDLVAEGDDAPTEFKSALLAMHGAAVMELEAVAVAFREQLQSFWNAHPELRSARARGAP